MATEENTSQRLGAHGNIQLSEKGCNAEIGSSGLEPLHRDGENLTQYVSKFKHQIDTQINIKKFGEVLQDGLDNTKEMAAKWNWKSNNNEFNWRDKPVELRIYYDPKKQMLRVQVWNELIQVWVSLSLTKSEILKILDG